MRLLNSNSWYFWISQNLFRSIKKLWVIEYPGVVIRIHPKNITLPILGVISLVWYAVAPTGVSSMIMACLGSLLVIAYFWARELAIHASAQRKLQYTAFQVGDEFEEHITLKNISLVPILWAEFIDRSNIPEYDISDIRSAGSFQTLNWKANTVCSKRGVFNLGPWEICMGDPFGIFSVTQTYQQHETIIVYPPLAVIPRTLFIQNQSIGSSHQLPKLLLSDTLNAATTRPLIPGDPLHKIHWRTTAKRDKPFIKIFDPEASSRFWLLPDVDKNVQVNEGKDSSLEAIIILTASIAAHLLNQNLTVGLLPFSDPPYTPLIPQKGNAYLWPILRSLAALEVNPYLSLADCIERSQTVLSGNDILIAITPSIDHSWAKSLQRLAFSKNIRNNQAILLDPTSFKSDFNSDDQSSMIDPFLQNLMKMGILARSIKKEDIHPIPAALGALRRWEFTSLGTGKVVVRQKPRMAEMGKLSLFDHKDLA